MAEFWFDTNAGKLVVGEAAHEEAMEHALQSPFPVEIESLPELLTSEDFPYKTGDFRDSNREPYRWSDEEKRIFGHWTLGLVERANQSRRLTTKHMKRMHILDLGPALNAFDKLGGLTELNAQLEVPEEGWQRFSSWSTYEFVEYARKLALSLGRKPLEKDYEDADGPSRWMITNSIGGMHRLNEYLGYPNIADWEDSDFIDWGARVLAINGEDMFVANAIRLLSKQQRGPSTKAIINKFGTFAKFKKMALEEYYYQNDREEISMTQKIAEYEELVQHGEIPLLVNVELRDVLERLGRYKTALACLPDIPASMKHIAVMGPVSSFIPRLVEYDERLTPAEIELVASEVGVFDDIWPLDYDEEYLVIHPEALKAMREKDTILSATRYYSKKIKKTSKEDVA